MTIQLKQKKEKGLALIFSLFVVILLSASIGILYMRSVNEAMLVQNSNAGLKALSEAEAGIAYAYAVEREHSFQWYTHTDKNTRGNPGSTNLDNTTVDSNGYLVSTAAGRFFKVKTYPEAGTGVVVIRSQATVNNVTRTIEKRLGQNSAYKYFFFFPLDHTFDGGTFDGRKYGSIHVNGDTYFKGSPNFYFLQELSCGPDTSAPGNPKGRFYRSVKLPYPLPNGGIYSFYDASGEQNYSSSAGSLRKLEANMYQNTNYHFETGNTTFKYGDYTSGTIKTLPAYLEGNLAADAAWNFQKYPATSPVPAALYYKIQESDLKNVASYQIAGHPEYNLLSDTNTVNFTVTLSVGSVTFNGSEKAVFTQIKTYSSADQNIALPLFWPIWNANHANDYPAYTDGRNWERKFFWAIYQWSGSSFPYGVNKEWWEDMNYATNGTDRTSAGTAAAKYVDSASGSPLSPDSYFLDSEKQKNAWRTWLTNNNLIQNATNTMQVKDKFTGGSFIDPGNILGTNFSDNELKAKAKKGGIYIGPKNSSAYNAWKIIYDQAVATRDCYYNMYLQWQGYYNGTVAYQNYLIWAAEVNRLLGIQPLNPDWPDIIVKGCVSDNITFYNGMHPPRLSDLKYQPSKILQIDIYELTKKITAEVAAGQRSFNGILYIDDLSGYNWPSGGVLTTQSAKDAIGVILVNAERLPDGGLSVVTPHNVYIKGNYNLDPASDTTVDRILLNRPADDAGVITTVTNKYSALGKTINLKWQPAEIISQRAIYTLSENFNNPQAMPLLRHQYYQHYDEFLGSGGNILGYSGNWVIDHPYFGKPSADWMPSGYAWSTKINSWFSKTSWTGIDGTTGTSTAITTPAAPSQWSYTWIRDNWGPSGCWGCYSSSDSYYYYSNNNTPADSSDDVYIYRKDLAGELYDKVYYNYRGATSLADGNFTDGEFANKVTNPHIYNTAIATPYDPQGYNLELWQDYAKTITGAFIQLPASYKPSAPSTGIPAESYTGSGATTRFSQPTSTFNYESRFGLNSPTYNPRTGLTFSSASSWRQVDENKFQ